LIIWGFLIITGVHVKGENYKNMVLIISVYWITEIAEIELFMGLS